MAEITFLNKDGPDIIVEVHLLGKCSFLVTTENGKARYSEHKKCHDQ
jgi:hypothetical protein